VYYLIASSQQSPLKKSPFENVFSHFLAKRGMTPRALLQEDPPFFAVSFGKELFVKMMCRLSFPPREGRHRTDLSPVGFFLSNVLVIPELEAAFFSLKNPQVRRFPCSRRTPFS